MNTRTRQKIKAELRRDGHPIVTEVVEGRNRYGEKTRWARYRMGARG